MFAYIGVQHILTIWERWRVSYKRSELIALREHMGSPLVFGGVRVARCFSFLCYVLCFVCLRPVSCLPNVANFSRLSILDYPFGCLECLSTLT